MFEVKGLAVGANIGTNELTLDRRVSRWQLVIPFLIYCALSILLFGRALLGHFSAVHIGSGGDPPSMMWSLAWWPPSLRVAAFARKSPYTDLRCYSSSCSSRSSLAQSKSLRQ